MSLIAYIIPKPPATGPEIAAFDLIYPFCAEGWRYDGWGRQEVADIGCTMIHSLRYTDIYAFDEDLQTLRKECDIMLAHWQTKYPDDDIVPTRLGYLKHLIEIAEQHPDLLGVCVG